MNWFDRAILLGAGVAASTTALAQSTGQTNGAGFSNPWASNGSSPNSVNGTSASVRPDIDTADSIRSYDNMLSFSRCAANIGRPLAEKALAQQPESASERRYIAQMQDRFASCRQTGLSNTLSLQRGSLAEGLYRKMMKSGLGYAGLQPTDPGYRSFTALESTRNSIRYDNDRIMAVAVDCLVAQQPGIVHDILISRHGSPQEASFVGALFPAAPACAGPVRPRNLSTSYLRAFLADSAYQYALFRSRGAKLAN